MNEAEELRQAILAQVAEYYRKVHQKRPFEPGQSTVHYAGRVYDEHEMQQMVSAVLDFWLTAGPYARTFEQDLARFLGLSTSVPLTRAAW